MYKTFAAITAFAAIGFMSNAALANGRSNGASHSVPQHQSSAKPAVAVATDVKAGGLLGVGVGATVGGKSLLNVGAEVKTPVASVGLDLSGFSGGVGGR